MTDAATMAYINMFGVLGALPVLCQTVPEARETLRLKNPISLCLCVRDGPAATLTFTDGACEMLAGERKSDIRIPFSSPEKFNGMINGTVTPIPSHGFTKIKVLTCQFIKLTDILARYLRPAQEALGDPDFFRTSTTLMLQVIGGAAAQIGNHDKIGSFSASNMADGMIWLSIKDGPCVSVRVKEHVLSAEPGRVEPARAVMEFMDFETARGLFDGKVNAMDCIGRQQITMRGMISMLDNLNRILDRVAVYLA